MLYYLLYLLEHYYYTGLTTVSSVVHDLDNEHTADATGRQFVIVIFYSKYTLLKYRQSKNQLYGLLLEGFVCNMHLSYTIFIITFYKNPSYSYSD